MNFLGVHQDLGGHLQGVMLNRFRFSTGFINIKVEYLQRMSCDEFAHL